MSVICICGVCVPYTVLWPVLLLFLKKIWDYIFPNKTNKTSNNTINEEPKKASCCTNNDNVQVCESEKMSEAFYLTKDMKWNHLISREKKTFVRFTANWCKPCKAIEPLYNELAIENHPEATFLSVDVDEFDELAAEHSAITIPLFVCFQHGKSIGSLTGKDEEKIKAFVAQSLSA